MIIAEEDYYLSHVGTPRHSGRYPWGSGEDPKTTRNPTFHTEVLAMQKSGLTEKQIAENLGMTQNELRNQRGIAKLAAKQANISQAERMQATGQSVNSIAKEMGESESTVRSWLKPGAADRANQLTNTTNMLKQQIDEHGFIDVGKGVEYQLNVSENTLSKAVTNLKNEGYKTHSVNVPQATTQHETTMRVLGPPGSTQRQAWEASKKEGGIGLPTVYSDDLGRSYTPTYPPKSISSKRIGIKYKEDGGGEADGVIYVRPGVKDVALGNNRYAQVRVMVDNTHFVKGMAMYKEDLPDGVDLVFNTNKSNTGNKLDALKPRKKDDSLPFGSITRQINDKPGGKPTSVMNIVNDDDDWDKWTRTLSSQMLSKQDPKFAKDHLDLTHQQRLANYESIKALTNSTVRKKMLEDFADSTDSASVHLKAAAMPGQAVKVILPISSMHPKQVYAPKGFKDGDTVVLIRFPHGGKFEIPELTVNNRNAEARKLLGDADNVIGIHSSVAKHLSGADFDGDTVLVIPNRRGKISHQTPLEELKNFDHIATYPKYPGMKIMGKDQTQTEMGKISNLITDMSIKGAPNDEIVRAVKHSMVVIDAEKHELNYRASRNDNNIKDLEIKYQRRSDGKGGAATIISKKRQEVEIPQRREARKSEQEGGPVNPLTGEKQYTDTGNVYKSGKRAGQPIMEKVPRLSTVKNAHELSSGTPIEAHYANYSNNLKALANQARLDAYRTPRAQKIPSAAKTYEEEVNSLNAKLINAKKNAPLERQAQIAANSSIRLKKAYDPEMDKKTYKKISAQAIDDARKRIGTKNTDIEITPKEWDAIQAGAISDSKLSEILGHAKMEIVREYAAPKSKDLMTPAMTKRVTDMIDLGYTRQEISDHLGISVTTIEVGLKE